MKRERANNIQLKMLLVGLCIGSSYFVVCDESVAHASGLDSAVPTNTSDASKPKMLDVHDSAAPESTEIKKETVVPVETEQASIEKVAEISTNEDLKKEENSNSNSDTSKPEISGVHDSAAPETVEIKKETEAPVEAASVSVQVNEDENDPVQSDFTDEDVIDTTQARQTSGNWVFKNYWWRKIEEEISLIKDVFEKVMATQKDFFVKRANLDKELDVFYLKIGFEQGPLENIIKFCLDTIEKEKNKQNGILTAKEGRLFEKIKEKQRDFEQLKEDTKSIQELDEKVDAALEILLSQIDLCNKYQTAAWDIFKKVSHELNDKIARKQYYVVKGFVENAQHVLEYVSGPFTVYFEQLEEATKKHMGDIESKIQELTKAEFDLRKETELLEKDEEEIEALVAKRQQDAQKKTDSITQQKELEKKELEKKNQSGFWNWCVSLLATIKSFFCSVGNWVSSLWASTEKKVVEKVESTVVKQL